VLDGSQLAVLGASVPGYASSNATISVNDNETASLSLVLPATVVEGSGVLTNAGTVSVNVPVGTNATINLSSSDTTELIVPATVVIPSGQNLGNIRPQCP